jgi:hypothetical protein
VPNERKRQRGMQNLFLDLLQLILNEKWKYDVVVAINSHTGLLTAILSDAVCQQFISILSSIVFARIA